MSDDRPEYLASGSGEKPEDHERLDMIRSILADEALWSEPPPEVGRTIIEAVGDSSTDTERRAADQSRRIRWLGGAAAAILVLVVGFLAFFNEEPAEIGIAMAGTELETEASGQATLRPTGDGWWIRLEVKDLPAALPGTYYEGWMWSDDGDGVSIGTFHLRGGGEEVTLWSGVDPTSYPSIWVTLEDEDGDPAASERVVMRGRAPDPGS